MKTVRSLMILSLFAIGLVPEVGRSAPSSAVVAACRDAVPEALLAGSDADALAGRNAAGEWFATAGQMDGMGSDEAILVSLPAGKKGRIRFVADRGDGDLLEKDVKLKGRPVTRATVSFPAFAPGRALAHVDAGDGGQALLHWSGKKLSEVWKAGAPRDQEFLWFELEDLDADGSSEVIIFVRRELDVFTDDEVVDEVGGSDDRTRSSGKIDPVAVYHLDGEKWKKSGDLLGSLR